MKGKRKRAAWIYAKLYLRRISAADVARDMDPRVSPEMVQQVIRGVKTSRRVQEAVAKALRMKFEKVWGEAPSPQPPPTRGEGEKE